MEYLTLLYAWLLKYGAALLPAALGACIAQLLQKGIAWRDRLVQIIVGIVVSHYATLFIITWWALDPFVGQSISFVVGLVGYHATPKLIASITTALASIPGRLLELLPSKKEPGA